MVGAKIVDALLRLGYRVRVLSRQHPNVDMQAEPHVEVIEGDLRDESTLIQFCNKPSESPSESLTFERKQFYCPICSLCYSE